MGFNRRTMEDRRADAACKEDTARRATDSQVLANAQRLVAAWNERQGRSRQTTPSNRAMSHVPSAQPNAMNNPQTNQTNNAFAEISGTIRRPPFDRQDVRPTLGSNPCSSSFSMERVPSQAQRPH